ncbi:MAG: winged helix-turn-helix transcriptional regulator [Proteobacteria bacterium]|jgi:DNA-binding transcriptional ArsR family regulator|nr:winged helix-turn-helix transcriptional regulator [Pseudomonadota bacterium]MBK9251062.1 winged helix-turn-helix transcriptional regulator [Pseudomonadota bacterium]
MKSIEGADELATAAEHAADFLRTLAHPARLRMVCALLGGELTAGELAQRAGLRAPAVSQQATVLEAGDLIRRRRDARTVYYRLSSPAVRAQARLLHRLFCKPGPRR